MDDRRPTPIDSAALRRSLRDSEDRFRLFVESVTDYAMFMLTPDGRVETWNVGAERIKGWKAEEIIGSHFSVFYPEEDVRSGKCDRELEIAASVGRFEDEGWRVRKDGSRFCANVVISAVRDDGGRLVGFSKVTRDLTARRQAEAERLRLGQAEEAVRLRDEFLSIATHELKTPLTALRLQLQSLRDGAESLGARVVAKIERALRSTDRLSRLVDTLVDVSRIRTGRLSLTKERFDLAEAVADVCDRLQEQAERARTELVVRAAGSVVGTWDRLRIEQVVGNLVTNAFKYAPGAPVTVCVGLVDGEASIVVEDRGPGIPEAALGRVFERFERAAPLPHDGGGLGLGLYVSREIVQAHGGRIEARNVPEGGARFSLRLPLEEPRPRPS